MMKALLIVTALGGADYQVEMPSMELCLNARTSILEQNVNIDTLCVPKENQTQKFGAFFDLFAETIDRMKEMEQDDFRLTDSSGGESYSKCYSGPDTIKN